jgi:hypothetical protein
MLLNFFVFYLHFKYQTKIAASFFKRLFFNQIFFILSILGSEFEEKKVVRFEVPQL